MTSGTNDGNPGSVKKSAITFDAITGVIGAVNYQVQGVQHLNDNEHPVFMYRAVTFELSFPVRTGDHSVWQIGGVAPATVAFRNFDVADPTPKAPLQGKGRCVRTHATIAPPVRPLSDSTRDDVLAWIDGKEKKTPNDFTFATDEVLPAINRFLAAYRLLSRPTSDNDKIRLLKRKDINQCGMIVRFQLEKSIDPDVGNSELYSAPSRSSPPTLPRPDLTEEQLSEIKEFVDKTPNYPFLSLINQMYDFYGETDFRNALLYAVLTFESAHSEFVERHVSDHVTDGDGRKLASNLLKEAGLSALIVLTPYLFMDAGQRPTPEVISTTKNAITWRNALVHSKRGKDGTPTIDNYRESDLMALIDGVIEYINCLLKIIFEDDDAESGDQAKA